MGKTVQGTPPAPGETPTIGEADESPEAFARASGADRRALCSSCAACAAAEGSGGS